jgi:DNA-binding transcriptional ArsR family regulator
MPSRLGGWPSFVYPMTAHLRQPGTETASNDRPDAADERSSTTRSTTDGMTDSDPSPDVATDDLLELLGDEYACDILRTIEENPMPAREIVEQRDMSRPTVYRRLDRLTEAGIVATRMRPDPDGHHRQVFHLVVDEIEFHLGADGVDSHVPADDAVSD